MNHPSYRVLLMDGQTFETRGVPRETTYKLQFETGDGRRINVPLANVQFWERLDSTSANKGVGTFGGIRWADLVERYQKDQEVEDAHKNRSSWWTST